METDVLMIDLPQYCVAYSDEKYCYSHGKGKENLKKVLYDASRNYCMYCYTRIKIDKNEFGAILVLISPTAAAVASRLPDLLAA